MASRLFKALRAGSQPSKATAEELLGKSCSKSLHHSWWSKKLGCSNSPTRNSELNVPVDPRAYEKPRDTILFPPGLGQNLTDTKLAKRPHEYSPADLRMHCLQGQGGANGMGRIQVVAASYCKQDDVPMHEFILVQVRDNQTGLGNFMVLDRTIDLPSAKPPVRKSSCIGSSCVGSSNDFAELLSAPARDRFRISYYGDEESLTKYCGLQPYSTMEKISFDCGEPFQFYELMILALSTSLAREMYKLFSAQCYWFASTVWECMGRRFPKFRYVIIAPSQGQLHSLFQKATSILDIHKILDREVSKILASTADGLLALKNELLATRESSMRRENQAGETECLGQEQTIEQYKKQIEELTAQLATRAAEIPHT